MDPGVVKVLHDVMRDAFQSPENTRVRAQFDMPSAYLNTEQYQDFIIRRAAYERDIVTRLGIRME